MKRKRKTSKSSLRYEIVQLRWRQYPDGRQVCLDTKLGKEEYSERTQLMRLRQMGLCLACNKWLPEDDTTFDHDTPRGLGGARRDDRISDDTGAWMNRAVHLKCNSERGSRRLSHEL